MKSFKAALTLLALGVPALLVPPAARAQTGGEKLPSLFPHQASITVEGLGLARLALTPEVLAASRPDLSDVRIIDSYGREVPYWIESDGAGDGEIEARTSFAPRVEEMVRRTIERDDAPNIEHERFEVLVPAIAPPHGRWVLVIDARSPRYARRIVVKERAADGVESTLVEAATIFRLEQPLREKNRIDLPDFDAVRLVIEIEGEEGFFLEPTFSLVSERRLPAAERVQVPLAILAIESAGGHTEVELARPLGLVPDLLEVIATTASFSRAVEVWDEGPGSSATALGSAVVLRVEGAAPIADLEFAVRPARGDRLRLVIADGDSPPLENLAVRATLRRPNLVFSASSPKPLRLLFGGARAYRPRYDLEALRSSLPASGQGAEVAVRLRDAAGLAIATLGATEANPDLDPQPALAFAMRPGAQVDKRFYRHSVDVRAAPSAEGLSRVRLGLDVLAAARPDLADLRLVDASGSQWAYLLERQAAREVRPLPMERVETAGGISRYEIELPEGVAEIRELTLDTTTAFFDRRFELTTTTADGQTRSAAITGRLARRIGDPRPLRIFPEGRFTHLELAVHDGDDAPLAFDRVEGSFPLTDLYFAAPVGQYTLLVGRPEDQAPVYELNRVRNVVLAVTASQATMTALGGNEDFSARARLVGDQGWQTLLLWVAIGLAVIVLGWLSLRLARQETG